jgi:hypothetical protein
MKIIEYVKEWTRHEWPTIEARQPRFFPLATAYVCPSCRTVQDGAPRGACVRCGSKNLRSVDVLLNGSSSTLHARINKAREAKRKAAAEEALKKNQAQVARSLVHRPDQEPQILTEFRIKDS